MIQLFNFFIYIFLVICGVSKFDFAVTFKDQLK